MEKDLKTCCLLSMSTLVMLESMLYWSFLMYFQTGILTITFNVFSVTIKAIFGVQCFEYSLETKTETNQFLRYLKKSHRMCTKHVVVDSALYPDGFVLGDRYMMWVQIKEYGSTHTVWTRNYQAFLDAVAVSDDQVAFPFPCLENMGEDTSSQEVYPADVQLMMKRGTQLQFVYYDLISLRILSPPNVSQSIILDDVCHRYQTRAIQNFKCLLTGPPGTGKSYLAKLLTHRLHGVLVTEFQPTQPGESLASLLHEVKPSPARPLILLIDEYDEMVKKLDHAQVHPKLSVMVHNKHTHNQFLDFFDHLEHVILVLTTNKPKSWFDEIDDSYTRAYRIHEVYTMTESTIGT